MINNCWQSSGNANTAQIEIMVAKNIYYSIKLLSFLTLRKLMQIAIMKFKFFVHAWPYIDESLFRLE